MPEFYAEHVPSSISCDFIRGYFETAEWLLEEEIDRAKIRGWSKKAQKAMRADCRDFMKANADLLAEYAESFSLYRAGMNFFLSREGHGAGFFDDNANDLQQAARSWGGAGWAWIDKGWLRLD
jgi:hypothetical protein